MSKPRYASGVHQVLIVGAGVSGVVLATALTNAGLHVDIVEIHSRWDVLGVGISLQAPALRALKSIGLLDRCVEGGFGYSQVFNCDRDGNVKGIIDLPRLSGPQYPACVGMMRPVLQQILADAMSAAGGRVRFGVTVRTLKQTPTNVEVNFTDGTSGVYDLVVGADGARSKVREAIFGVEVKPIYTEQAVWRAMVPRPAHVSARHSYYDGPRHAGFNPVSTEEMYIYLVQTVVGDPRLEPERWPAVMRELLANFGGHIGEVREQIVDPARIVYRPIVSLLLPAPWHRGHVILLGDAAHTPTPQLASGATIAIEDSIVLAELIEANLPLADVFERFMTRRYERCRMVVENSRRLSECERSPSAGDVDPTALAAATMKALAAPI